MTKGKRLNKPYEWSDQKLGKIAAKHYRFSFLLLCFLFISRTTQCTSYPLIDHFHSHTISKILLPAFPHGFIPNNFIMLIFISIYYAEGSLYSLFSPTSKTVLFISIKSFFTLFGSFNIYGFMLSLITLFAVILLSLQIMIVMC